MSPTGGISLLLFLMYARPHHGAKRKRGREGRKEGREK
jgi:hypothetical protein